MNDIIKTLETQCTDTVEIYNDVTGITHQREFFDKERFVKLIVAECLQQVKEQYVPVLEDELMMRDTHWDGYVQCGVDSYVAIKEHFYGEDE